MILSGEISVLQCIFVIIVFKPPQMYIAIKKNKTNMKI